MPTPTDLRRSIAELTRLATTDLAALWRQVTTPDEAQVALLDVLPSLVEVYGLAAGTVAADWYDDLRDEQNIDGRFFALVAGVENKGADILARWAVGPLYTPQPDYDAAFTLAEGGLQRRIADVARETVIESSIEDPKARGWQRIAAGGCAFCQMLAGRGAVYSEASADFASHDHCQCQAAPAFDDRPVPVKPYTPSERVVSDADRARVREYLRTHDAG